MEQLRSLPVLSLNNSRFGEFVDRIYPIEVEIKDTTDTDSVDDDLLCPITADCVLVRSSIAVHI
jgi:hypothetical protein